MFWCNPDVNEAFLAYWSSVAGCSGYPSVQRIWSTVDDFACTGDTKIMQFGFVTTSNINSSDPDDCAGSI